MTSECGVLANWRKAPTTFARAASLTVALLLTGIADAWAAPPAGSGVECTLPIETLNQIDRLGVALARDEPRWNSRPALGRWLNAANYDNPVRPDRYRIEAGDIEALGWMLGRLISPGASPDGRVLARALLLPQLESFASTAMQACGAAQGDGRLRAGLVEISRAWLALVLAIYQRPDEAELMKRLQASRRKTFTLLRQAQAGDAVAIEGIRALSAQAAADAMTVKAAALYEEVARLRDVAMASRNAPVAAALSLSVHTAQQASSAIGQAQAAANLQLLDGLMAAAPVVAAALRDSRIAAERESALGEACGSESANQSMGERMSVFECRRRWEAANPTER